MIRYYTRHGLILLKINIDLELGQGFCNESVVFIFDKVTERPTNRKIAFKIKVNVSGIIFTC